MIKINQIKKAIELKKTDIFHNDDMVFGIRGDNKNYKTNNNLTSSHENGNQNMDSLNATCAIGFDENNEQSILKAIKNAKDFGNNVYLIYGDFWGKGEDVHINEIKIKNAECLLKII